MIDAFCGSGTTLIAAERSGRVGYGIELDPVYVDVSLKRWQTLTGKEAVLVETGETFAQVAERRVLEGSEEKAADGVPCNASPAAMGSLATMEASHV